MDIPPVTPSGGLPSTQGFNFQKPQPPDFAGMTAKITQMTAKMTVLKSKTTIMQTKAMAAPPPMGVPFNIATNFMSMIESFTGIMNSLNDMKSMITSFQSEWNTDNILPGSDIREGGNSGQFGLAGSQSPGFSSNGGISLPGQPGGHTDGKLI